MENIVSINGTDIKPIEQVKPPRQIGFEILRIIAMFLISCIHVNEYGGIIEAANFPLDLKFLQAIYVVAVNVFVLISGYFLVSSKISYKKILKLWLQVLFYSLITFLVAAFVFSEVTNKRFGFWGILKSCMPVTFRQFWFFSAYFILNCTIFKQNFKK